MKRIVTVQDISCVGKCSLTVALPIISAMGVEAAIIPTAVLSTHTMFKNFTFCDLTDEILKITEHWKQEQFSFDAIYTGYLGSQKQLDILSQVFADFKTSSNAIIVDPVMADHGKFYPGFDAVFAEGMKKLCAKADIVLPNLTEASLMLQKPYIASGYDRAYIEDILKTLHALGVQYPVVTGVSFEADKLGVMAYIPEENRFFEYYNTRYPLTLHGTGDVFASTFTGAYVQGKGLEESLRIAVDYVCECICASMEDPEHRNYGANFELALPYLVQRLKNR